MYGHIALDECLKIFKDLPLQHSLTTYPSSHTKFTAYLLEMRRSIPPIFPCDPTPKACTVPSRKEKTTRAHIGEVL